MVVYYNLLSIKGGKVNDLANAMNVSGIREGSQ